MTVQPIVLHPIVSRLCRRFLLYHNAAVFEIDSTTEMHKNVKITLQSPVAIAVVGKTVSIISADAQRAIITAVNDIRLSCTLSGLKRPENSATTYNKQNAIVDAQYVTVETSSIVGFAK